MTTFNLDNIDLGSFGITDKPVETIVQDQREQELNSTMSEAIKVNPDQHAKNMELSKSSGMPLPVVESDPVSVETDLKLQNINLNELVKNNPVTASYLNNFDNAARSHDDIDNLKKIEKTVKGETETGYLGNLTRAVPERITELLGSVYKAVDQAGEALNNSLPLGGFVFEDSLLPRYAGPEEYKRLKEQGLQELTEQTGNILKQTDFGYKPQSTYGTTKEAFKKSTTEGLAEALSFSIESTVHSTPDMLASFFAFPAYILSFSEEMGEEIAKNKGLKKATLRETIEAAPFAIGSAILERILPEKIFHGMGRTEIEQVGSAIWSQAANKLKSVMAAAGSSLITEASTEAVQEGIIEYIGERYSTDAPIVLNEMIDRAIGGAIGGGLGGGVIGGVAGAIQNNTEAEKKIKTVEAQAQQQELQVDQEQRTIDVLRQTALESKLLQRDPEAFKQFVKESDGDKNTNVFLDGEQVKMYLADKDTNTDPAIRLLSEKVDEAASLGGDISIPLADFTATIAPSDHFDSLRNFMSLSAENPSPFRREQIKQDTTNYVNQLLSEAKGNTSNYVEAQNIYESVKEQLVQSGTVTPQNAKFMAQVVPAWAAQFAKRNGITIKEAYENSGLKIEGDLQVNAPPQPEITKEEISERLAPKVDRRVETRTEGSERRVDPNYREKLEKMPIEERYEKIYLNELTNLRNRRAFKEDVESTPWLASIDADSLKTVNDNLGQDTGDELLIKVAKALNDVAGDNAYHISGDEFYIFGDDPQKIQSLLETVREKLKSEKVTSEKGELQGLDITWGISNSKKKADSAMKSAKKEREEKGERAARGELPKGMKLADKPLEQSPIPQKMYSAVDRAVGTLNISGWKNNGKVKGDEIWNKLKSTPGVKREELDWLGVQEFLTVNPDNKFTREEVQNFVQSKGIKVEEVITDNKMIKNRLSNEEYESKWELYTADGIYKNYKEIKLSLPDIEKDFYNKHHFPDRNLVAFLRTTERNLDGRTFFVEEFQSDWHQRGRQYGYQVGNKTREEVSNEIFTEETRTRKLLIDFLTEKNLLDSFTKVNEYLNADLNEEELSNKDSSEYSIYKSFIEQVENTNLKNKILDLKEQIKTFVNGVPDAPFKEDAWMSLALKRALIYATENDFDSFAWSNSEVLANRWSRDFIELYKTQYDKKTPSIIKKLTGQTSEELNFKGEKKEGYHIIKLTPELKSKILNEGFPLLQEGPARTRGYYDPAQSVIRLTQAADLSTFLHEFAHFMYEQELQSNGKLIGEINGWYKRNAESVAKEASEYAGTQVTKEDVSLFLDNQTTGDVIKDKAIRRAVHEHFARGFETYVMEGKAPSIELRNAFRAFARWLTQIYQAIRGDLRVNLDDQMRDVFARMLASEEQIALARARAKAEPLFTEQEKSGMEPDVYKAYEDQVKKAEDKEAETLRNKLIKEITRQTETWWKEQKADLVDEELEHLKNTPVYRAGNALKNGDLKLDYDLTKAAVGENSVDKRDRISIRIPKALQGMTDKTRGVSPDIAAAFLGYGSGAELLSDLINAVPLQTKAEANAESKMLEMHGDILHDGTIQQQADEAVRSEERGKLLLMELKALNKNKRAPNLEIDIIKNMAEENIAKLSYREIHPAKYRKAEIQAAREAALAVAQGNTDLAAKAKTKQILNFYLGKAATEARENTMRIVTRMQRYEKKKVREEIQKAENGYWEQIQNILARFEFKKSATLKDVESLNLWMKTRIDIDGDALVLSPTVLNESLVTHWKNIPYEELQGISDSVKNIEHVARYSNNIVRQNQKYAFKELVQKWVDHMNKFPSRFKSQRTDVVEGKNWGRWAMAQMTKIPFLASWLDGQERVGLSHQILVQPFTDAQHAEVELWKNVGNVVLQAIEGRTKEDRKRHNTKIFIPEIKDETNDGNLFGHQVLAVALNTGNESNLRKLLLGEGWADINDETTIGLKNPKLQAVLKHMTESDWKLVQLIWDQMEQLYPQLAEVHRKTTGLVPPKISPTPINTQWGTFKGGYYPVKYDPNRSFRSELNEERLNEQTESMFTSNGSIQSSVNASATNERTKYYAPIRLSLDVVAGHFQEVIHYITHHDAVRETNKMLRNKDIADTIKAKLGKEEYAQLRPWLNDIAKDGKEAPAKMFWDDVLGRLRFGITLGTLGFKASTGILQITGLSNTVAEIGLKPVLQACREILSSKSSMKSAWEFASSNSKVLLNRSQTMDREIKNAMKRLESKNGFLAAVQEVSMKHIGLIQTYMVDLPSWYASYIKKLDETGNEQESYQYADWIVENIQGSGTTKNLARIMRNQTESGKMFTMFMTYFSSLWNLERDLVKGARSGAYSTTSLAAKCALIFVIPVLFDMLLRGEFGDDDETTAQKILTKTAVYPLQSVPFLRDIVSGVSGEYGYNISPVATLLESGTQKLPILIKKGFTDEEISSSELKATSKFVGAAVGVPGTSQAWVTGEHLYDVMVEGEDFSVNYLLLGKPKP